jgi:hypothetical protein
MQRQAKELEQNVQVLSRAILVCVTNLEQVTPK